MMAWKTVKGSYTQIMDVYAAATTWMEANGYEPAEEEIRNYKVVICPSLIKGRTDLSSKWQDDFRFIRYNDPIKGSEDYEALGACVNGSYIDVNMLVKLYREQVNPRVNVFCIQTAGYTNVLVPEYGYRTVILYGWTGKELIFADAMNRTWNELESKEPEK